MTHAAWPLRALFLGLLGLAFSACSRPSSDGRDSSGAATARSAPALLPALPSLTPEAPAAAPSRVPVLTPEDAEDEAEHRITEQNLESELDRLEREIQAE